jgi:hypothetical protein
VAGCGALGAGRGERACERDAMAVRCAAGGTRAEAEEFAVRMRESEMDLMFNVEAIKASTVWN